jgi:hypothetical protein
MEICNFLKFLNNHNEVIQILLSVITVILSIIAIRAARYIPHRIMVNQRYSDMMKEYRSTEMGTAIFSIFHFYVQDCKNNSDAIAGKYKEKYDGQIKEPLEKGKEINYSGTLHFQRRLVAQFYFDLARLRYEDRLPVKHLREWFTPREVTLLAIILHMVEPAKTVFEEARDVPEPPDMEDEVLMNKWIYKLYEEAEGLEWE